MLLGILGMAALGALGYNAVKDEDSRTKTKGIIAGMIDEAEKIMDRKFQNGEIDEEEYWEFKENRDKNVSSTIQWKLEADMLRFRQRTGCTEDSEEYQRELERLQHKYFD